MDRINRAVAQVTGVICPGDLQPLHIAPIDLGEWRISHPARITAVIRPFLRKRNYCWNQANENDDENFIHISLLVLTDVGPQGSSVHVSPCATLVGHARWKPADRQLFSVVSCFSSFQKRNRVYGCNLY